MATRYFDATLSADVNYIGDRWWKGDDINKLWNLFNYNSDNRASWGLDAQGWLQYRSAFGTYAGRYNTDDVTLGDTYFETDIQPAGSGNYEVGFFMRFIDRYSFYYLTFNGGWKNWGNRNIRLYKVSGTTHTMVADAESPVFNTSTVYKFRCELVGNTIKIYKDGTLIINWTDNSASPYIKGAFGPWVLGQEFAKWRGFQARNNSPFTVSQRFEDENVTSASYDAASAKLIGSGTVGQMLQDEVDAYLASIGSYDSWSWRSFRVSSSDARVITIFDRVSGKNISTDPNSRVYAYQTLPTSPPLAPTNLQGVAINTSSIRLSWQHADDSEDGFRIYDENDNLIATVGENILTYTETGLQEGTVYRRKVKAFNTAGESAASNTITVQTQLTPPQTPTNFKGVAVSDDVIRWSWTNQSTNEAEFELVTWDQNNNLIVVVTGIPKGSTSYEETGLQPATRYVRAIRAKNSAGVSGESNPFEVTTMDALPDPPQYAPHNFYGIGVSDTAIFWYWYDTNPNETGFELLDKDDNVIAIIDANESQYMETGLYSLNVYQRKLRAFNPGGKGPLTPLATARTLSDGQNQIGKPVPPIDLQAEVLSTTEVKLTWQYTDDVHMPAVGFKLYLGDGTMLQAIPIDVREHIVAGLLPNTSYRMYLTAYNDNGDSLPTNVVEFGTPHIVLPPPDPIDPSDLEDPFYGVDYDEETQDMPKLTAFQSGVGDRLDLVVRNLQPRVPNLEIFSYEVYLIGEYEQIIEGVKTKKIWESARVVGNQREVSVGETLSFTEQIPSPKFEIPWQEINAKFPISNYKLIFTSSNPNVELFLEREITDFFPQDKVFIELPFRARIINETQTAWYPSIHTGYYYLNQQEWFLYVDDKVQPVPAAVDEEYVLKFPYIIKATGSRHYDAQTINYIDTTRPDFLQGEIGDGIDLDREIGAITLNEQPEGVFTSRIFRFGRPVTQWYTIEVDQDLQAIADGASFDLEVGASDYLGNVLTWYPQTPGQAINLPESADKIRYRLRLREGFRHDIQTPDYYFDNYRLGQGTRTRTIVVNDTVLIEDVMTYVDGTYMTVPLYLGEKIDSLGNLRLTLDIPGDSSVRLYTVTFEDPNHDYTKPTVESPWIPAPFIYDEATDEYIIPIGSAIKPYIVVIMHLTRGTMPGPDFRLDMGNFQQSRATNLYLDANGFIALQELNRDGRYVSEPYYVGDLASISGFHFAVNPPDAEIRVQAVFGATQNDVITASQSESAWRTLLTGRPPQPWMIYRLIIRPATDACTWRYHDKDTYEQFANHAGRTNFNINSDGSLEMIDISQRATYTSEVIPVALLNSMSWRMIANGYANAKVYIKKLVNGVWTTEEVFNVRSDGSLDLSSYSGDDASHIQWRLEVNPASTQESWYPIDFDDIRNRYWADNGSGNQGIFLQDGIRMTLHDPNDGTVWDEYAFWRVESPTSTSRTHTWESPIMYSGNGWYGSVAMRELTLRVYWPGKPSTILDPGNVTLELRVQQNGVWTDWQSYSFSYSPPPVGQVDHLTFHRIDVPDTSEGYQLRWHIRPGSYRGSNGTPVIASPGVGDILRRVDPPVVIPSRITYVEVHTLECNPVPTALEHFYMDSTRQVGPRISNIHIQPKTYTETRVVPMIYEVRLGGYIEAGDALETYAVPMTGELVTDFKEYPITSKIVEDIVYEYLASRGILFDNSFHFTDYQLQVDPVYPVELRTEPNGLDKVYAKATSQAGELLYRQVRLYFNGDDNSIILTPIPQHGNPICITNAAGQLMRHVHFRDDNGNPSLTNLEEPLVEYQRYLFLQHSGIDPATLEVYIEDGGVFKRMEGCSVIDNRVIMPVNVPSGTRSKVKYRLMNSYVVEYNYAPEKDYCKIRVHTAFDPNNVETRRLEIKYEAEKETPYYLAKEVDLNPLRTTINSGFIYLTDTVYPPFKLDVVLNPNVLYRDKEDRVVINAYVLDEFGNPVVGEKADFSASVGSLQVLRRVSDQNGMVSAVYTTPGTTADKATVTVHIVSRDVTKQISKTVEIFFVDSQATNKIAIISEKHLVKPGDVVSLKVKVMGANNEPLAGRNVQLYADQGTISPAIGTTDANGEISATYEYTPAVHVNIVVESGTYSTKDIMAVDFTTDFEFVNRYLESDLSDGYVYIEAETYDDTYKTIREQILLGISGV